MVSADAGDGETAIAMSECLDSGLWVRVNLSRTPGVAVVEHPLGTLSALLLTAYIYSRQPGQEVVCLLSRGYI